MKKINKNNLFMYVLVILAVVMLSSTLTMAVLTDRKKGKEDLVFGRVAISGENSCLELVIDEPITQDSEILNDERYLYFSPTDDTEPMIVRLNIEYQIDEAGYDEQIEILNSTIADDNYFVTYIDETYVDDGYEYIYDEGYFYLVMYGAPSVSLENMFVILAEDSVNQFIISEDYIFHLESKAEQASVFTNLVSKNLKLVVTVEAAQREGLESLADVWEMPVGAPVSIGYYDDNLGDFVEFASVRADANGNITLPISVPSAYSGEVISFFYDGCDEQYAPGSTVNLADIEPIDENTTFEVVFAGLYGEVVSVSGDPVNSIYENQSYSWQDCLDMGIFTVTNNVLSGGTSEYYVYDGSLHLPYNITTITSSAFNQYNDSTMLLQIRNLTLPGNLVTIEEVDENFLGNLWDVTMFDKVENLGNFYCNNLHMDRMYFDKGIYYIGSGNNPYFLSAYARYNDEYDPADENNNWGYNFPDNEFRINANTKFVSLVTLLNYTNVNTDMKTNPLTDPDLPVIFPTCDYEYVNLDLVSTLFSDIGGNQSLMMMGPFLTAPFLTHEDGVLYLGYQNNSHYAVVFAYAGMTITQEVAEQLGISPISFDGIEQGGTVTLNSNTQIILPGAFSCVHYYTLDPNSPIMFSLVLNEGLTRIEDGTFANTAITSVTLPNTLTYIGNEAFNGCKALTSVTTIPATVSHIGYYAFANTAITSFTVANGNTHYTTYDNGKYLVKTSGHVLIQYAVGSTDTAITIPSDIYSLAVGSFVGNATLLQVTIPSTVTSVAYQNEDNSTFIYHSQNNGDPITAYIFELSTVSTNEPETKIIIDSQSFYNAYVTAVDIEEGYPVFDLASGEYTNYFYIYINTQFDNNATSTAIFTNGDGGYKQGKSDASYNCYRFFSPGA